MTTSSKPTPSSLTRRQILTMMGIGGGTAAAAGYGLLSPRKQGDLSSFPAQGPGISNPRVASVAEPIIASGDVGNRLLVVIELRGGNDGLATVIPDSGRLRDLRPNLVGANDTQPVPFVEGTGLHPGLAPLRDRGLAVIEGIGTSNPDGSHFEMETRWWEGDGSGQAGLRTGFLGRLCDHLDVEAPITGLSLGAGDTPFLLAERATTVGLPDPWAGWFLNEPDPWYQNLRRGLERLGDNTTGEPARFAAARAGIENTLAFGEVLGSLDDEEDRGFPETQLGYQLQLAGGLLDSDFGVRILHVPFGGFDTHDGQMYSHDDLMTDLGSSMAALQDDLATRGLAERTLIMTTSEFGRRPEENGSGTDHGTAGPALVCGPVVPGVHGDAPDLSGLDADGNLIATTMVEEYYATIAEGWLGIPAASVLAKGAPQASFSADLFTT